MAPHSRSHCAYDTWAVLELPAHYVNAALKEGEGVGNGLGRSWEGVGKGLGRGWEGVGKGLLSLVLLLFCISRTLLCRA